MNWNITAGRPVYVQLVEQLSFPLVAGGVPARQPYSARAEPLAGTPGSTPTPCSALCRSWKAAPFAGAAHRRAHRHSEDNTALQALRRRRAGTLAAEFLHQMQASA